MQRRKKPRIKSDAKEIKYIFKAYNNLLNDSETIKNIQYIFTWSFDDDIDDYLEKLNRDDSIINYRLFITLFMLSINNDTTINPVLRKNAKNKCKKYATFIVCEFHNA